MKTIEELREILKTLRILSGCEASAKELEQALDELEQYRNNPPLTHEQLKEKRGKQVWYKPLGIYIHADIKEDGRIRIIYTLPDLNKCGDLYMNYCDYIEFIEGEFFAKEVKNEE